MLTMDHNNRNRQLINFLDPKLCPKVTCKTPVTDFYEAENLISANSSIRSRGFLAYQSVKPPVELEFEFLCKISLDYVKLNTTVGTQKCSGIEIFAKSDKAAPYVSLAKAFYDQSGVIFCNSRTIKPGNLLLQENDKHICFLRSNTFRIFLNCVFLKVVIFRSGKYVPCIGSLQVWGVPSCSCSSVTVQTIYRMMHNTDICDSLGMLKDVSGTSTENKQQVQQQQDSPEDLFEIPEDFKDNLTLEVMTIPMTLPSGKTIDQSTLDKHIGNEKSFGRKAGDPFTGKEFSSNCKPVLNVALKSRIDLFMIRNQHRKETYRLPRIVGRSSVSAYGMKNNNVSVVNNKRKYPVSTSDTDNMGSGSAVRSMSHQKVACSACDSCEHLYLISSCNHIYCRSCVLECCKRLECYVCKIKFDRDNIVKHNV